jgi:methyl-accepting chemotaxis protein
MVIVSLTMGLAFALALALYVRRLIVSALNRVTGTITAMSHGDLTSTAGISSRDEIGRMARALDLANEHTRQVIQAVTSAADGVYNAADGMSAGNERIASTAEQTSSQR